MAVSGSQTSRAPNGSETSAPVWFATSVSNGSMTVTQLLGFHVNLEHTQRPLVEPAHRPIEAHDVELVLGRDRQQLPRLEVPLRPSIQ